MSANISRPDAFGHDALGTGEGRLADLAALLGADAPEHLIHFDGERFLGPY